MNYFELKYLITDTFYEEVTLNGYTFGQAAGICYESFTEYVDADNTESVIAISSIILLKLRHKLPLSESDMCRLGEILDLYSAPDFKDSIGKSEFEYLDEEMQVLKEKFNKL